MGEEEDREGAEEKVEEVEKVGKGWGRGGRPRMSGEGERGWAGGG